MQKLEKIDYTRLLGFDAVGNEISGTIDFQDATFGAKLGAKVGGALRPRVPVKRAEDAVTWARRGGYLPLRWLREIRFSR